MATITPALWHVTLACGATALACQPYAPVWCQGCQRHHAWDACEGRPI